MWRYLVHGSYKICMRVCMWKLTLLHLQIAYLNWMDHIVHLSCLSLWWLHLIRYICWMFGVEILGFGSHTFLEHSIIWRFKIWKFLIRKKVKIVSKKKILQWAIPSPRMKKPHVRSIINSNACISMKCVANVFVQSSKD